MLAFSAILVLLGVSGVASAAAAALNWTIPVFTRAVATRVSSVSAVSSSFLWEGVFTYTWRDDSLGDSCSDGDTYAGTAGTYPAVSETRRS